MIRIREPSDLNWINLYRVARQQAELVIDDALLQQVDDGYAHFCNLIDRGVPSYGVTTGLGKLVDTGLDDAARAQLPANMLRARAVAIGDPLSPGVSRAMLLLRLVNFLSGRSAVRADLCRYIVDRLNDGFTPWIPSLGHGMAADAIANTHAFQTLIGEGFVFAEDGSRQPAGEVLQALGVAPFEPVGREGLALINGVCAAPALAFDVFFRVEAVLDLANLVAAAAMEGLAAPRDAIETVVGELAREPGIGRSIETLRKHLNHSAIQPHKLQAPVSYRVVPQVHGALHESLARLREKIDFALADFSDNPMVDGDRILSVGSFHNQHLANQADHLAVALAHVGALSERRLHRLLASDNTGLNPQLAARPGLDAGLVVTQKACLDLCARLRQLAQPLSLATGESSAGQEDYMSMAIPALDRFEEMCALTRALLAYELLAAIVALRQRGERPGDGVAALLSHFDSLIAPVEGDRSFALDVETILAEFASPDFAALLNRGG